MSESEPSEQFKKRFYLCLVVMFFGLGTVFTVGGVNLLRREGRFTDIGLWQWCTITEHQVAAALIVSGCLAYVGAIQWYRAYSGRLEIPWNGIGGD